MRNPNFCLSGAGRKTLAVWCLAAALGFAWATPAAESEKGRLALEKGKLALLEGRYAEAQALCTEALATDPDSAEAHYFLGLAKMGRGEFAAGEKEFTRTLELDPSLMPARVDRAWSLLEQKRPEPALAELEQVLAEEPGWTRPLLLKGQALYLQKDWAGAAAILEEVAARDPNLAQAALLMAGSAYERMGEKEKATEALLNAQAVNPDSADGKAAAAALDRLEGGGEAGAEEKRWQLSGSLFYQYDTNIAVVTEDSMLPEDVSHREDSRMVIVAGALYRPVDTESWDAEIKYDFYDSFHFVEDELNLIVHRGTVSGVYSTEMKKRPLRLRVDGSYQWSGLSRDQDEYSQNWRLTPAAFYQENDVTATEFSYRFEVENLADSGAGGLDRDNTADVVLLAQHFVSPGNRAALRVGGKYLAEDADGADYDLRGAAGLIELRAPFGEKARGLVGYEYDYRDYYNHAADRRDETHRLAVRFEQDLSERVGVFVGGNFGDFHSTLSNFDYDRTILTVGLSGSY